MPDDLAKLSYANNFSWTNSSGDDRRERTLATVERNVAHLIELTHKLESLARVRTDGDSPVIQAVSASTVACEAARQLREMSDARGVEIRIADSLPRLTVDVGRLELVFVNLLSNAVKFSPAGGVIRIVGRVDSGAIQLEVADQGPGIAPVDRERIFEPFYQGRNDGAGPVRGTGIGLSVVKEYVFGHGGSIEVVDGRRGAHLRVRLPLAGVGEKAAAI